MIARGFTLVELLVAMTITLLIAAALAGIAQPARAAFDRVPAELELQQRGRTAIDALSQALRASLRVAAGPGVFNELTVIVPVADAAQGALSVDQTAPGAAITLGTQHCPNIKDVCGFTPGAAAMIADARSYDVFTIAATSVGTRRLTPSRALTHSYVNGSTIVEVEQFTFELAEQADGSYSLIRRTAAGAIQPIVDFAGDLSFDVTPGRVDVSISLEPPTETLRTMMTGRSFRASIKLRNAS